MGAVSWPSLLSFVPIVERNNMDAYIVQYDHVLRTVELLTYWEMVSPDTSQDNNSHMSLRANPTASSLAQSPIDQAL